MSERPAKRLRLRQAVERFNCCLRDDAGTYAPLGIAFRVIEGHHTVQGVKPGSPAANTKMRPGDMVAFDLIT